MFVQGWAMPTPPQTSLLGNERSHGCEIFTQILLNNFDINISLRELTLYTTQIHMFRPLDFTHMNICPKSISVNHNVAP